jgi:nitric-oxide synthase, bacterial
MARCPVTGLGRDDDSSSDGAGRRGLLRLLFRRHGRASLPAPEPLTTGSLRPDQARVRAEAREFLDLLRSEEVLSSDEHRRRAREVEAAIAGDGTYAHTPEELAHGARVAWRNAIRCIGRLYWSNLTVRDLRHLDTAEGVFDALVDHLRFATNGGRIQPTISIFAPRSASGSGIRIWNPQLIRYAGYRQSDATVIGDPGNAEFTDVVRGLGWAGGAGTPFDLLPLVIQMPGEAPRLFELPEDAVLEVPISHPEYAWFAELGLKWHALPVISNMRLDLGGVSYTAAPFNGWYMGTEIGARNLADVDRYNMLPTIAQHMGLDTSSNRSLWRDRALVELNVAVLHSFQEHGVAMVDHHTASKHHVRHEERERAAGRSVPGDWSWLVPPMSGSTSALWSRGYKKVTLKPAFLSQKTPWSHASVHKPPMRVVDAMDELTGLMRRAALEPRLETFAAHGGAVAVLDLDGFAALNAEHGRQIGDAVLQAVGREVLRVSRPDDVCVRLGGDELCVLLGGIREVGDARAVAERIRAAVGSVYVKQAPLVTVRASMGVALLGAGQNAAAALEAARGALGEAKVSGRDRLHFAPTTVAARRAAA